MSCRAPDVDSPTGRPVGVRITDNGIAYLEEDLNASELEPE